MKCRFNVWVYVFCCLMGMGGRMAAQKISSEQENLEVRLLCLMEDTVETSRCLEDSITRILGSISRPEALVPLVDSLVEKGLLEGRHVRVVGLLDAAIGSLEAELGREPANKGPLPTDSILKEAVAHLKITLGAAYEEMGLWNRAMDIYFDLLGSYERSGIQRGYNRLLNNIANVYFKQGYMDKARFYYDSAIAVNIRIGDDKELFNNYNNLAALDYTRGNYAQTLELLAKALALVDQEKEPDLYYLIWANMAAVYEQQGKTSLALEILQDVFRFEEANGRKLSLVSTCLQIANLYEDEPDSSYAYLRKALDLAETMGNQSAKFSVQKALFQWYYSEKWYKDACDILMESSALKDSLDRADNRIKMENVEASYLIERENAEKDLKLKQMQIDSLESSKQTAFLLALLVCLLVLSVILCWLFLYQKRLKKRESDLSARQKRLYEQEKELMAHKEQDYKDSLELRNKELTSKTLYLMRNNEYIADISRELQELLLEMNPKDAAKKNHVREILVKLRNQGNEGAYEEFQYYFEKVYSSFYRNLTQQYPDLTHKDLRLCSFLKLGLSAKEIASITFKEVRSVEMAQYRLRKKMGLDTEVNLIDFFTRF